MKHILLANMGAPNSLTEMRTFLKSMFMDKSILYAPKFVRVIVSSLISTLRYRSSWQKYELIGGSSLQASMQHMAADLQCLLGDNYEVESVYAYSAPFIEPKLIELAQKTNEEICIISMYPQASYSTTGSVQMSIDKVKAIYPNLNVRFVEDYFAHPLFVDYWSELIVKAAAEAISRNRMWFLVPMPFRNHLCSEATNIAKNSKLRRHLLRSKRDLNAAFVTSRKLAQ
jgi:protoporphyrin/coproporphyrin ferrochelatase